MNPMAYFVLTFMVLYLAVLCGTSNLFKIAGVMGIGYMVYTYADYIFNLYFMLGSGVIGCVIYVYVRLYVVQNIPKKPEYLIDPILDDMVCQPNMHKLHESLKSHSAPTSSTNSEREFE